jgi:hypothetical protein
MYRVARRDHSGRLLRRKQLEESERSFSCSRERVNVKLTEYQLLKNEPNDTWSGGVLASHPTVCSHYCWKWRICGSSTAFWLLPVRDHSLKKYFSLSKTTTDGQSKLFSVAETTISCSDAVCAGCFTWPLGERALTPEVAMLAPYCSAWWAGPHTGNGGAGCLTWQLGERALRPEEAVLAALLCSLVNILFAWRINYSQDSSDFQNTIGCGRSCGMPRRSDRFPAPLIPSSLRQEGANTDPCSGA